MLRYMRDRALRWVFGAGMGATLADRGIDWLSGETRKAIAKEPVDLARVTLRPGETYTVIARPPATRAERRLARAARGLGDAEQKLSAATPRQRRAARKLRSAQRHLDRTREGTRRHRRAVAAEAEAARRFDKVMAPSAKLRRVRADKARVDAELDLRREASFRSVRSASPMTATVYD
jgi:hypothetical protein